MRVTPKITVSPADIRNSETDPERPVRSWLTTKLIAFVGLNLSRAWPERPDLLISRQVGSAIGIMPVDHNPLAVAHCRLSHEGPQRPLVIQRPVRCGTKRRVEGHPAEAIHQPVDGQRSGAGDPGGN